MLTFAMPDGAMPLQLAIGMREIVAEFPRRFAAGGIPLRFIHEPALGSANNVAVERDGIVIRFGRPCDAFRALGRLLGQEALQGFAERASFDTLSVLLDMSRNAVLTVPTVRTFLCRVALMGFNALLLYTKDAYEVPDEPFFGYLRGPYTADELRAIDDFAFALGIEVIPCIQALGHLEPVLQWPVYGNYRDNEAIILAGWEESYQLLEKMITAISAPLRSSRIHLGMDETHGLGTGRFASIFGPKRHFDIFNEHLARLMGICRKHELQPMIWSDMYFRMGSPTGGYYDLESVVPPDVIASIPSGVQFVYWDYYHTEQDFYERFIAMHERLGVPVAVAGGIWSWTRFWTAYPYTMATSGPCLEACKAMGIKEVMATCWADDGFECDIFSTLPGLQFYAEHCYGPAPDGERLQSAFRGSCGADFVAWTGAGRLDYISSLMGEQPTYGNISKWLLWQDPALSLMDPQLGDFDPVPHYTELADELDRAAAEPGNGRLAFPAAVARAISSRAGLRRQLAEALRSGNRQEVCRLRQEALPAAIAAVTALWHRHRDMWLAECKPFGLEVLDCRYGGLLARLDSISIRLDGWLEGRLTKLPELEVPLRAVYPDYLDAEGRPERFPTVHYDRLKTPSYIK